MSEQSTTTSVQEVIGLTVNKSAADELLAYVAIAKVAMKYPDALAKMSAAEMTPYDMQVMASAALLLIRVEEENAVVSVIAQLKRLMVTKGWMPK